MERFRGMNSNLRDYKIEEKKKHSRKSADSTKKSDSPCQKSDDCCGKKDRCKKTIRINQRLMDVGRVVVPLGWNAVLEENVTANGNLHFYEGGQAIAAVGQNDINLCCHKLIGINVPFGIFAGVVGTEVANDITIHGGSVEGFTETGIFGGFCNRFNLSDTFINDIVATTNNSQGVVFGLELVGCSGTISNVIVNRVRAANLETTVVAAIGVELVNSEMVVNNLAADNIFSDSSFAMSCVGVGFDATTPGPTFRNFAARNATGLIGAFGLVIDSPADNRLYRPLATSLAISDIKATNLANPAPARGLSIVGAVFATVSGNIKGVQSTARLLEAESEEGQGFNIGNTIGGLQTAVSDVQTQWLA